ncbi:MAG: alginate export family protein [Methylococcaceae bacterium]
MKIKKIKIGFLCFLTSFSAHAEDTLPFNIDYSSLESTNPLQFYANVRALYGEGVESDREGRTREDFEQLKLGMRYQRDLPYNWFFKGNIRGVFLHRQDRNDFTKNETWDAHFEAREFYVENKQLINDLPLGVLAGRKQFRDDRGWWYDNQLDVAQLQFNSSLFNADVSYGGRLIDERVISESQNIGFEDSEFIIAHLDYQFYYQHHFQAYTIYQKDDFSNNRIGNVFDNNSSVNSELDLLWIGFRFNGLFSLADKSKLNYWVDFATINGSEREFTTFDLSSNQQVINDIRDINVSYGYGIDLGAAWKSANENWGLAANYAIGSGDSSDSNRQSSYRQPTIANNKGKILGNQRVRLYGELLRPELSNLQLVNVTAGHRFNEYFWLQGSYFHYWQIQADKQIDASILTISPNGKNKEIGNEVDLTLMATWTKNFNAQLTLSGFHAGDAYDQKADSKYAYKGVLEFQYYW